jgi:hypothetical protein
MSYLLGGREASNEVVDVAVTERRSQDDRQQSSGIRFGALESIESPHASSIQVLVVERVAKTYITDHSVMGGNISRNLNGVYIEVRCDLDAIFFQTVPVLRNPTTVFAVVTGSLTALNL